MTGLYQQRWIKSKISSNQSLAKLGFKMSKSRFKIKQSSVAQLKTNLCFVNPSLLI